MGLSEHALKFGGDRLPNKKNGYWAGYPPFLPLRSLWDQWPPRQLFACRDGVDVCSDVHFQKSLAGVYHGSTKTTEILGVRTVCKMRPVESSCWNLDNPRPIKVLSPVVSWIGLPPNHHPFIDGFSLLNQPAIGVPPWLCPMNTAWWRSFIWPARSGWESWPVVELMW